MPNTVPSVGVVVMNRNKSRVLLVKHKESADHLTGTYGLPAGRFIPSEESAEHAAVRELEEETGLKTTVKDLVRIPAVYHATIQRKNGLVSFSFVVFLCQNYSGELSSFNETIPEWKQVDEIKNLPLLPNIEKIIQEAL
ncbi:NUDIX hydrolase [Candidatus Roizmanbacteria bacterium]|nr:NUDIX hydrolase [Candidatus Roizmanbacteria bacterium]